MKKFNYTLLLATLLLASCGNDNENENITFVDNNNCQVSDTYLSDCLHDGIASNNRKTPIQSNSKKDVNDRLKIDVTDNYVSVNVTDFIWACDAECIDANCDVCGDTIKVQVHADGGLANCICEFDYSFKIGPLNKGNYTLVLCEGNCEYCSFEKKIEIK